MRSEDFADGFAGSAYYEFSDQAGNIIFALIGDGIGVNGKGVPGKDDVDQPQTRFIPLKVATEIYSVKVFGVRTDDTSIDAYVAKVHQFAAGLEKAKGALVYIGVTVADIIAAIEAA